MPSTSIYPRLSLLTPFLWFVSSVGSFLFCCLVVFDYARWISVPPLVPLLSSCSASPLHSSHLRPFTICIEVGVMALVNRSTSSLVLIAILVLTIICIVFVSTLLLCLNASEWMPSFSIDYSVATPIYVGALLFSNAKAILCEAWADLET